MENCEMTYGTKNAPDGTAVEGLIVKSKVNGETIFLPSAGDWWSTRKHENCGSYWASSICKYMKARPDRADCFLFSAENKPYMYANPRSDGLTIRPVSTKKKAK